VALWGTVLRRWLHELALGVWIGGIAMIALSAPLTFREARRLRVPNANQVAGRQVGEALRVFNHVTWVLAGMLLVTGLPESRGEPQRRRLVLTRAGLVLAGLAVSLYLSQALFPAMDRLFAEGRWDEFRQFHRRYSAVVQVQLVMLLAAGLLSAWLHTLPRDQAPVQTGRTPFPAAEI
jgi:putative copper export protein